MQILPVPCLRDNYAYLVWREGTKTCAVVDPSEAKPIEAALTTQGLTVSEIWITHHHWDHVDGLEAIADKHGVKTIRGSRYDQQAKRIKRQSEAHVAGDTFEFSGAEVSILEIPGHTLGAIAFVTEGNVFTGDTLFLSGCGRVFEGSMAQMASSMKQLAALPPETKVYCGHEYTLKNLAFAKTVEPNNPALDERIAAVQAMIESEGRSVPGTIADELATNPFVRFDQEPLRQGLEDAEAFGRIRELKDAF